MSILNYKAYKKLASALMIVVLALSLFGCKKPMTLDLNTENNIRLLVQWAVESEVMKKYGADPIVSIEKLTAYDESINSYYYVTFTAKGNYCLFDENRNAYYGDFKVTGHYEAHGEGWDSITITDAKRGSAEFPVIETELQTSAEETVPETTAETTVLTLQSEDMLHWYDYYSSQGLTITVFDPKQEFEEAYGAIECFRAYDSNHLIYVYLFEDYDAAKNAEYYMFTPKDGSLTASVEYTTAILDNRVLIAEACK